MTKLMAFDLDGTILFNRAVEPANERAIARWQAEGNLAVSCTGKSIFATQLALEPTAIRFDYHVLYTGAVVTDRDYRIIYRQTLPLSVVRACYEHFSSVDGVALFATTLDNDYSLCDRVGSSTNILPEFTPLAPEDLQNHEYVGVPLWIPDVQVREAAYTWILERFGNSVDCHKNQDFLDIVPPTCTKGTGLQHLVEYLQSEHPGTSYEVHTIGDSWNDIDMHRYADRSASFSYSPDEVKAVTTDCVDKAYEFIEASL